MRDTTFLYELKDPRTGETRYLGKSDNPFKRLKQHLQNRKKIPVSNWIKKLRNLGFVPHMELLDEISVSRWQFWEQEYIRVFRSIGVRLLNLSEGGESPMSGKTHSLEAKEKIRLAGIRRKPSLESRLNMSRAQRGNTHNLGNKLSESTKEKISHALSGNTNGAGHTYVRSSEWRAKQSASHLGKKLSEEHKKKIGASNLGRVGAFLGKKFSTEHKQKISDGLKAAHAAKKGSRVI